MPAIALAVEACAEQSVIARVLEACAETPAIVLEVAMEEARPTAGDIDRDMALEAGGDMAVEVCVERWAIALAVEACAEMPAIARVLEAYVERWAIALEDSFLIGLRARKALQTSN